MPLGFGRSVFTHKAAAGAAVTDRGYFQSAVSTSDGTDGAIIEFGITKTWNQFTMSFWFKGQTSDFPSDNFASQIRATGNIYAEFINLQDGAPGGTGNIRSYTAWNGANVIHAQSGNITNFDITYLDDTWHHCLISRDQSTTAHVCKIYLDGTQVATDSQTGSANPGSSTPYITFNGGAPNVGGGFYNNSESTTLQFADLWIDDVYVSDVSKFYSSGPVELGSDGTGTGLSQPDIWLTCAGGSFTDGGNASATLTIRSEGTGNYTQSSTGGPGA